MAWLSDYQSIVADLRLHGLPKPVIKDLMNRKNVRSWAFASYFITIFAPFFVVVAFSVYIVLLAKHTEHQVLARGIEVNALLVEAHLKQSALPLMLAAIAVGFLLSTAITASVRHLRSGWVLWMLGQATVLTTWHARRSKIHSATSVDDAFKRLAMSRVGVSARTLLAFGALGAVVLPLEQASGVYFLEDRYIREAHWPWGADTSILYSDITRVEVSCLREQTARSLGPLGYDLFDTSGNKVSLYPATPTHGTWLEQVEAIDRILVTQGAQVTLETPSNEANYNARCLRALEINHPAEYADRVRRLLRIGTGDSREPRPAGSTSGGF